MNSHLSSIIDHQNIIENISQQGDVCNQKLVEHIFSTENVDVVFHLAAKTHVGKQLRSSLGISVAKVLKSSTPPTLS